MGAASAGSGLDAPVGMPRPSSARWWRVGSRNRQALRPGVGNRRYGCQPNAIGTGRRPVGITVAPIVSRASRAVTFSSTRCGNGNAGASTSMAAQPRGVAALVTIAAGWQIAAYQLGYGIAAFGAGALEHS